MTDAELFENALKDIVAAHVPDQPASSGADEVSWAMQHVATIRMIAKNALDNRSSLARLEVCEYCGTWRSKPCGEGCHFDIEGVPGGSGFRLKIAKVCGETP
jgi:hypothetical protein